MKTWRLWFRRRRRHSKAIARGARVLGCVAWCFLASNLFAAGATAGFHTPLLDNAASRFAHRPVKVLCKPTDEDWNLSAPYGVWGYVMDPGRSGHTVVWDQACVGALAIDSDSDVTTDYMKAMGVAVVVHEAFHLKDVAGNRDEGVTECRAMRHYEKAMTILGAEPETKDRLMPVLLEHYWAHKVRLPQYLYRNCQVPPSYDRYLGYPPP